MNTNSNAPKRHNHIVTDLGIHGGPRPQPGEQCPRHQIPIKPGAARCAKGKKKDRNCR